ncbi:MAG TPA: lysoplasmalogenase [Chitinophagaceae bacterium]|nr:lysoplasmalogenase [Chitinophagaceae bacterium]
MPLKQRWVFLLLIAITAIDLVLLSTSSPYRLFTKPLLMPLLIWGYTAQQNHDASLARLIIAALLFSWMGDIFLMFDHVDSIYFILGLCSFLTTHILYIMYFLRIRSHNGSYLKKRPLMLLVIVAYTIELLYILWPSLDMMKIPVSVYAIVISAMLATAAWQYGKIKSGTAILFTAGAFLFVLSDSALAVNKFHKSIPGSSIFVMLTYVAAQTLIVLGSIRHQRELAD